MNISKVVSTLISQNGWYGITLPFIDETTKQPKPIETVIQGIIEDTTVPMYSQFVPWLREGDCDLKTMKCVNPRNAEYMLPMILTITPVMWVNDVHLPFINARGTFGDVAPAYGINRSVQGVLTSQAYMMVAGQMRNEPSFDYLGHNKIRLYGWPKTTLTFEVACQHMPNLETIEDGCYDSFMQLATLDCKEFMYNNLKHYSPIVTAHGTHDLKIEDYQGASDKKEDLLEKWRDVYHVDMDWTKWM